MWKGGGCDHLHGSGVGYVEGGGVVTHLHGSGVGYAEGGGGCDPPAWLRGGVCGGGGS